jgi:hypothetical protein
VTSSCRQTHRLLQVCVKYPFFLSCELYKTRSIQARLHSARMETIKQLGHYLDDAPITE